MRKYFLTIFLLLVWIFVTASCPSVQKIEEISKENNNQEKQKENRKEGKEETQRRK